jgi:hypothetical protein
MGVNMKRKIQIYEWERHPENGMKWRKGKGTEGIFLQFGVDFEETRDGIGQFSTAIIELSDGSLRNVPVEMVQFLDNDHMTGVI